MAKNKTAYVCTDCGAEYSQWQGQCKACHAWNTLKEFKLSSAKSSSSTSAKGYTGATENTVKSISDVDLAEVPRVSSGMSELDRVLGGGIVPGSVVLIGGDPGVGKSSILLQVMCHLSTQQKVLYVTGEESLQQVASRARRMQLPDEQLRLYTETDVENITIAAEKELPKVMVVDSIQTMQLADVSSAAGGVSQVRETAAYLTRYAKQNNVAIFLVGHVTKSGEVAGPRVLEHIVDTVVFLEGQSDSRFRTLRAIKNRFGAVNELGVFAMTEKGMKQIKNPSAIFLSRGDEAAPGSVVMVIWEGSRPLLVEIQALVDESPYGAPRRVTVGLDQNRMAMLLAVMHRHGGIQANDQDVYVNVVGGVKVSETSVDLAVLCAILSSMRNKPLAQDLIVFGEVGLAGEIRPVPSGQERIIEAAKHGFKRAIVPIGNVPKGGVAGMEIIGVKSLQKALDVL
ncbi:DNA repair protein RadA [Thiomicrorhabdus lithotrophica]|uniref:DNA repair protein RadA n=1 Tax=Thiomicrorhabdus lithotrophica TaxID=2949997 RepID=A0ABY8CET5_9GAMM|nr:DNA repair protein RadA [Thiomicrorhabdus lithotrophica]WEJ63210.1 DNA repair protein RadA [Thiomicrorhabdus lithotrophica]